MILLNVNSPIKCAVLTCMHIPVSMHTGSRCENKSQSGVMSDKCLLCAADTHFETLMKFFSLPLVWFSICSAPTAAKLFEFFSISSLKSDFFDFPVFLTSLVIFSVLQQAEGSERYTMFECVLTPHLHKA